MSTNLTAVWMENYVELKFQTQWRLTVIYVKLIKFDPIFDRLNVKIGHI